jgi:hypothetical protein
LGLADAAVSSNEATARAAIGELRSRGPAGLDELLAAHVAALGRGPSKEPAWKRLSDAIDGVAKQKDAYASKLFWYTDLEAAKAAAAREGKAVLSLRLLGQLDCDLSCVNSRFFRTTLYPDPTVSNLLREKFVLHWSSERPVPVVTIDYGDGRVLKRTVTGNSVHYVLDATARPIDALPGLYSAEAFVKTLKESLAMVDAGPEMLRALHRAAKPVVLSKPASLSPEVVAMVKAKAPPVEAASARTVSKAFVEDPLVRLIRNLEASIAEDTVRNETVLHRQLHQWFATGQVGDMVTLNQRVYAELFLTPASDPWLGLAPADGFTALENQGLTATTRR